ncbi:TPA: hypothetical protein TXU81_002196 [Streptococcus suis]|nr:hypothetical protein [Streptococcus suis]HEL2007990.1 hypothetical protein [Streptococcus suis]HEL2396880.1 hypothetical protein [Streptococcus suis]HEP1818059.1 hypothetical protein [Streptococcus suis]HEP1822417.1 hypothetical protein [Streptococcus suis]
MIILVHGNSIINLLGQAEGFEPVLYTLDELQDTSFQSALDSHSQADPVAYTEKMTPLYFGFRKRDKRGKYRVHTMKVAQKLSKGSK